MLLNQVLRRSYFLGSTSQISQLFRRSFVICSNVPWNPTAASLSSSSFLSFPTRNAPLIPHNLLLQSVQLQSFHRYSTTSVLCNKLSSNSSTSIKEATPNSPSSGADTDPSQPLEQKDDDGDKPPEELTLFQRIKRTYKEHVKVFAVFHFLQWGGAIFVFYYLISSGYDLSYYMNKAHIPQMVIDAAQTVYGKLAIAVALTKITFPIRWFNSYVLTMLFVRLARSYNKFPPVSKEDSVRNLRREAQRKAKIRINAAVKKRASKMMK